MSGIHINGVARVQNGLEVALKLNKIKYNTVLEFQYNSQTINVTLIRKKNKN